MRINRKPNKFRSHHGFTLLELMVVVVIVGIIAALATGSYRTMSTRAELDRSSRHVLSLLQEVRATAYLQSDPVTCGFYSNGVACFRWTDTASPTQIDWSDADADGEFDAGEGEIDSVLGNVRFEKSLAITASGKKNAVTSAGSAFIEFLPDGQVVSPFPNAAGIQNPDRTVYLIRHADLGPWTTVHVDSTGRITEARP